jgi:predicted RecB family nuclease
MRLTASDIFNLYRPTLCALRIYLREQHIPEAEPGVLEQILQTLGQRHEQSHLATLGAYEDLGSVSPDLRVQQTLEAVRNHVPVIYQGELAYDATVEGIRVTVVGRPDFLILDGDAYLIRDSKLTRKVDDKHHVEIGLQLQLYGWLFRQLVGKPAKRLEVHAGGGDIIEVPYDGGTAALAAPQRVERGRGYICPETTRELR